MYNSIQYRTVYETRNLKSKDQACVPGSAGTPVLSSRSAPQLPHLYSEEENKTTILHAGQVRIKDAIYVKIHQEGKAVNRLYISYIAIESNSNSKYMV